MVYSRYDQDEDRTSWHGIEDPKKRKQIQDRIAQRARRKRLAASKSNTTSDCPTASSSCSSPDQSFSSSSSALSLEVYKDKLDVEPVIVVPMTVDHRLLANPNTSAYTAMFKNSLILGLKCGSCVASKSLPALENVPEPLKPTAKQLILLHHPWIDLFPFPRMRDHAIELNAIIDSEEFLYDLFMMRSFDVKAGFESWDPQGWRMGTEYAKKWGFLFY